MTLSTTHCKSFVFAVCALIAAACQPAAEVPAGERSAPADPVASAPRVVEVRTTDYAFHAPSRLASGWTTLRMTNEGEEPHFLVLWMLPEDKDFDAYVQEVYDPFMAAFEPYKAGETERDELFATLGETLAPWANLAMMGRGGVGFLSPGRTGETTVNLAPGNYVMECYMIDAEGKVHNQLGMLRPLTVTAEGTGASPPEADAALTLSNAGIAIDNGLGPGRHTVRVTVAEAPEGLLGHDVHLARLADDTALAELIPWMDWVDGLTPPAPAEFLGGAEQVPPGHTSYVTVELEPGRYAWISEGYAGEGLVEEFRVE